MGGNILRRRRGRERTLFWEALTQEGGERGRRQRTEGVLREKEEKNFLGELRQIGIGAYWQIVPMKEDVPGEGEKRENQGEGKRGNVPSKRGGAREWLKSENSHLTDDRGSGRRIEGYESIGLGSGMQGQVIEFNLR